MFVLYLRDDFGCIFLRFFFHANPNWILMYEIWWEKCVDVLYGVCIIHSYSYTNDCSIQRFSFLCGTCSSRITFGKQWIIYTKESVPCYLWKNYNYSLLYQSVILSNFFIWMIKPGWNWQFFQKYVIFFFLHEILIKRLRFLNLPDLAREYG